MENVITETKLQPLEGYVEVEIDGTRTYRNIDTGLLIEDEAQIQSEPTEVELLQQEITTLELNDIEHGQQITDLELIMLGGTNDV